MFRQRYIGTKSYYHRLILEYHEQIAELLHAVYY